MFFPPVADNPEAHRPIQDPPAAVQAAEPDVLKQQQAVGAAIRAVASPFVDTFEPLAQQARGLYQDAKQAVQDFAERVNPPMTEQEREAAKFMHGMLGPNKLGGEDRRFDHRDVAAIGRGLTDGGFKGAIARRVVPGKLAKGLTEAGVVEDPAAKPDETPRRVSIAQLERFEAASETISKRSENLERMLGIKVEFPEGIGQDAIGHLLEGKFGLPPGAKVVPAKKW